MSNEVTSLSLLQQLRDLDNDEAWSRFYDLYEPLIRGWLLVRGITQADADDVSQEVMKLAFVELARFDHNGRLGAFRSWLRQMVANRLKTHWRQQNRAPTSAGEEVAEQLADPHSELSKAWDDEYHRALCERLVELVEKEFQEKTMNAFRLVALEGWTTAEVARELELSENAVRVAQSRVKVRMRELGAGLLD